MANQDKTAYLSPKEAELDIIVSRALNQNVTILLDLGIPNFTIFSIKFPLVEDMPNSMRELTSQAFHALMEEVSAFMLSVDFDDKVIIQIYSAAQNCFNHINIESNKDSESNVGRDRSLETFSGTFPIPIEFVDETYSKIVTAATFVERTPAYRRLELTPVKPPKNTVGEAARVIRQYRNRSLRQQPKPLYVVVYDQLGRPTGTLPLGSNFKNRLLNLMKKKT